MTAAGRPIREEFLTFSPTVLGEAEIAEVVDTLRSGWLTMGPKCLRFEADFAAYTGAKHAISIASCTAGLHLALVTAGVGPGDEVITTPLTFAATANVIEHVGARPVFVDVERSTGNIDPARIEAALTPRTKAIIPVHLGGRPCDMGAIQEIAAGRELDVVEDAAHAVESVWQGRKIGTISRFTAFSFYATKNLTTGEGGMITTEDDLAAERLRSLRLHGIGGNAWKRYSTSGDVAYETQEPGFKYNMTDVEASIGIHQLDRIDEHATIRTRHWEAYLEGLAGIPGLELPVPVPPGDRHAHHLFAVLVRPEFRLGRAAFQDALKAEKIGTSVHFPPLHLHRFYAEKYGHRPGDFPNAEEIGATTVSLPLSPALSDGDVQDVIAAVRRVATG